MQGICTESLNWTTSGMGERSLYCGDQLSAFEDCSSVQGHDVKHIRLGCRKLTCPDCHYNAAARESHKVKARLQGFYDEAYKAGYDLGLPIHIITSPPEDEYHNFTAINLFSKINKRNLDHLKNIGIIGGCTVLHQVRGKPKIIRLYKERKIALPASWHWHTVGFMPEGHLINSDAFYDATGWVYKNKGARPFEGMRKTISYELNHAATYQGKSHGSMALRWWGATSYNAMTLIQKRTTAVKLCNTCTAEKHRYWESYDQDQGEARRVTITRDVSLSPVQLARLAGKIRQVPKPRPELITLYEGVMD